MAAFRTRDDLFATNTVTDEDTVLTGTTDIDPGAPGFSPEGGLESFEGDVPGGRERLLVVNADGTGLTELSTELEEVHRPTWHPTQDTILFEGLTSSEGLGLYVATTALAPTVWRGGTRRIGYRR